MNEGECIQITQNDKGFNLNFTVKKSNGDPFVLTGMAIELQVAEKVTFVAKFAGTCVITDGVNGTCSYTVIAGNFDEINNYYGILQFTKDGVVESTRRIAIEVIKELA